MFEAHPVTKERWPDLVELFDRPVVRTCFCMFYRKTGTDTGVGAENRRAMKALVDGGSVPGLIGYEDGVPVAWVSLGPREDYPKLRRSPVMKPVDDRPVWSIVCFFVDRSVRGKGLAERMLRAAVDHARAHGARLVEAYPVDAQEQKPPDEMFFGAKSMYDRAGFREVARRRPTRPVVRRALRPGRAALLNSITSSAGRVGAARQVASDFRCSAIGVDSITSVWNHLKRCLNGRSISTSLSVREYLASEALRPCGGRPSDLSAGEVVRVSEATVLRSFRSSVRERMR